MAQQYTAELQSNALWSICSVAQPLHAKQLTDHAQHCCYCSVQDIAASNFTLGEALV